MKALSIEADCLKRDSLAVFFFSLLLFTLSLSPELTGFQTRFALFAQEMFQHGPTWFPTLYGQPYPDYPGTSTFVIYLISLALGQVTPMAAILPTAVVSALILVATYRIGAIQSRRLGLTAVLFAVATIDFLRYSRSIALDQYTSLAATISFYLVYSATCKGRHWRLGWLPVVWIVGFAFRGPIGLVLPVAVVCSFYLWNRNLKQLFIMALGGAILLGLCMAGLWLAAQSQGGASLTESVINAQMVGRLQGRGKGVTYYWLKCFVSLAPTYPLAILVLLICFKDILRRKGKTNMLLGSLMCWILIVLVGLSIPSVKKTRYILPIVPALSLIAAHLFVQATGKQVLVAVKRRFLGLCCWVVPWATVTIAVIFLISALYCPQWKAHYLTTFLVLLLLTFLAKAVRERLSGNQYQDVALLAVSVMACAALRIGIADPIYFHLEETRPFVQKLEALQNNHPGDLVFYDIDPDGEAIKFVINLSKPQPLQFITSLASLSQLTGRNYVIAKERVFENMVAHENNNITVMARGKIGHQDCVVCLFRGDTSG